MSRCISKKTLRVKAEVFTRTKNNRRRLIVLSYAPQSHSTRICLNRGTFSAKYRIFLLLAIFIFRVLINMKISFATELLCLNSYP